MYGLGVAALREGFFDQAAAALSDFIATYPNDTRFAWARFLRGDAYLGLNRWADAIAEFEAYLAVRGGWIDSYARERIGDAYMALGQADAALAQYAAAAEASRSPVPLAALRERIAQVHISRGEWAAAVAQYEAILAFAQNPGYRATVEASAARAEVEGGLTDAALARWRRIVATAPETPAAYEAVTALAEAGEPADRLTVGRVAFAYGAFDEAINALVAYTTETPLSEIPAELYLLLGRAYREVGNASAAFTAFGTIRDQYPTDPLFGEALLEQGRTRFLADDVPGAIAAYLLIADTYGYLPEAAEALYRIGTLQNAAEQPGDARRTFERLADQYPDSAQAIDGLMAAAAIAFESGDTAGAERFYAEVARKAALSGEGETAAAASLQVGRLALARGDQAAAQTAFQAAVAAAPNTYNSARARDIILGIAPFQPPAAFNFALDQAAALDEAEAWLRSTFAITQEGALWPLSPTLATDPRMVRGVELWAVAAYDSAEVEFGDIITAYERDPLASYQIAIYLRGLAAFTPSIFAAANVIRAANLDTVDAPAFIARMRYPVYYLDLVQESAARYSVDPLLIFSLIRLESLFDTNATAAAGEKGLTQVIPSTAEYIAGAIDFPDYQHADLFRPYAGIEFGAFFLSENLGYANGNVTAALAGYNAGPGRAAAWLAVSSDHDGFVNAITIESTRGYVQRAYSNYTIYRALYGAGG
jgi:soluble lytic murein transglycosylase